MNDVWGAVRHIYETDFKISQVASAREEYSPPYTSGNVIIAVYSPEFQFFPHPPPKVYY